MLAAIRLRTGVGVVGRPGYVQPTVQLNSRGNQLGAPVSQAGSIVPPTPITRVVGERASAALEPVGGGAGVVVEEREHSRRSRRRAPTLRASPAPRVPRRSRAPSRPSERRARRACQRGVVIDDDDHLGAAGRLRERRADGRAQVAQRSSANAQITTDVRAALRRAGVGYPSRAPSRRLQPWRSSTLARMCAFSSCASGRALPVVARSSARRSYSSIVRIGRHGLPAATRAVGDVARDDAPGADDDVGADRHAGQDDRAGADEHAVARRGSCRRRSAPGGGRAARRRRRRG